jgi:hypothetical protein
MTGGRASAHDRRSRGGAAARGDGTAWPWSRSGLLGPPLRSHRCRSAVDRVVMDTVRPGRRLVPAPPLASRTESPDEVDLHASFKVGALRQLRWLRACRSERTTAGADAIMSTRSTTADPPSASVTGIMARRIAAR